MAKVLLIGRNCSRQENHKEFIALSRSVFVGDLAELDDSGFNLRQQINLGLP